MATVYSENVSLESVAELPEEYREVLTHQMLANGEGELSAGDTYVDSFYPLAPNADERYMCLKFGMEEVDHFRRFAKLLTPLGIDTSHMVNQAVADRRYFPAESMTTQFTVWEERAAFSFLCELEGHFQIKEMTTSTYAPLRVEADAILKEEARHFGYGKRLMQEAYDAGGQSRDRAQRALDRFYPMALDMFGRPDSRRGRLAVRWGLRKHDNGELRELYKTAIAQHIEKIGFSVPKVDPSQLQFA
ncbi:Phenylacetic acid catabolic protein [Streptomyces sp. NBC_00212]|uniref:Phenylacetic acid catabolic protein n=1 Tax=Streptomyces sp. NBC_00212 TaxID=2975684 RepID=UPI0032555188